MKQKLTNNLLVRIDDDLKEKLAAIQEESGLVTSEFVRQCLKSMVKYYEENGCIVMPVVVIPKKEYQALRKK